jgi:hypothetical protein
MVNISANSPPFGLLFQGCESVTKEEMFVGKKDPEL